MYQGEVVNSYIYLYLYIPYLCQHACVPHCAVFLYNSTVCINFSYTNNMISFRSTFIRDLATYWPYTSCKWPPTGMTQLQSRFMTGLAEEKDFWQALKLGMEHCRRASQHRGIIYTSNSQPSLVRRWLPSCVSLRDTVRLQLIWLIHGLCWPVRQGLPSDKVLWKHPQPEFNLKM